MKIKQLIEANKLEKYERFMQSTAPAILNKWKNLSGNDATLDDIYSPEYVGDHYGFEQRFSDELLTKVYERFQMFEVDEDADDDNEYEDLSKFDKVVLQYRLYKLIFKYSPQTFENVGITPVDIINTLIVGMISHNEIMLMVDVDVEEHIELDDDERQAIIEVLEAGAQLDYTEANALGEHGELVRYQRLGWGISDIEMQLNITDEEKLVKEAMSAIEAAEQKLPKSTLDKFDISFDTMHGSVWAEEPYHY